MRFAPNFDQTEHAEESTQGRDLFSYSIVRRRHHTAGRLRALFVCRDGRRRQRGDHKELRSRRVPQPGRVEGSQPCPPIPDLLHPEGIRVVDRVAEGSAILVELGLLAFGPELEALFGGRTGGMTIELDDLWARSIR